MFFGKKTTVFVMLMLFLSVSVVATPGAAAPQSGNASVYSSYSQVTTSSTTIQTKVVQDGVVQDTKVEKKMSKQVGNPVTKPLFPATMGKMYMHAPDGRDYLAITTASDDGSTVSGRICVAGLESEWMGDLMTYGHGVKIELVDNGNLIAKWENPDPEVSNARFIDYAVAHSGKLGPKAYLVLYVDGVPEYQKVIREKNIPSFHAGAGLTRTDGTGVDGASVVLNKRSMPGSCAMVGMSFSTSGGEYLSDPDMHMIAYFDGTDAVYDSFMPFTRVIDINTEPVYAEASLVTNQ